MNRRRLVGIAVAAWLATCLPAWGLEGLSRPVEQPGVFSTALGIAPWSGLVGLMLILAERHKVAVVAIGITIAAVLMACVYLNFLMFLMLPSFSLWGACLVETIKAMRGQPGGRA